MASKKPVLKLNGKIFDPNPPQPSVLKVTTFLDKQPDDEVFTTAILSRHCGIAVNTSRQAGFANDPRFIPYTLRSGKLRYWGNPRAIAALREQVGQ